MFSFGREKTCTRPGSGNSRQQKTRNSNTKSDFCLWRTPGSLIIITSYSCPEDDAATIRRGTFSISISLREHFISSGPPHSSRTRDLDISFLSFSFSSSFLPFLFPSARKSPRDRVIIKRTGGTHSRSPDKCLIGDFSPGFLDRDPAVTLRN